MSASVPYKYRYLMRLPTSYTTCRCMRILKESFDALVQFYAKDITDGYQKIDAELLDSLVNIRKDPSASSVNEVLALDAFEEIVKGIEMTSGSKSEMTVVFLQDISSLQALVSAVRDGDLELHLTAERDMLCYVFAFDHQNYARYLSYQLVFLEDPKALNHAAYQDLLTRGLGANYSGPKFASVHGDLVTEYFNRETKGTEKLRSYKTDPFSDGPATEISTGAEVNPNIIIDVLTSSKYLDRSVKASTRERRGEKLRKVHLESFNQKITQGNDWQAFFDSDENKEDLIKLATRSSRVIMAGNFYRCQ
eukprot:gene17905-19683_t